MKKTPLYDVHVEGGARMTAFSGFWMPLQYSTMIEEHLAVRRQAGLFDISHMGEFLVTGKDTEAFLTLVLTGDPRAVRDGEVFYSLLCNERGGIVDDLMVYRMHRDRFMLVVNAANVEKDYSWVHSHLHGNEVRCDDMSDQLVLIALQGPFAERILKKTPYRQGFNLQRNRFLEYETAGEKILISRTGYTGEDGFEIYLSPRFSTDVWKTLAETGKDFGLKPVGLGARDTLRLEARLPLFGHDLDDTTTPYEAGLGWAVHLQKDAFIGKEALSREKAAGPKRILVGFEMLEQGIPRQGCLIWKEDPEGREDELEEEAIGKVTSGTYSPSLKKNIGLGYVPKEFSKVEGEFFVEIRQRRLRAKIVKTPFYKRSGS